MIELISIDELTLLENNPRKITDEQFKKLCKSLKEDPQFFNMRPCLVNKIDGEYIVYAGNQRVRAAQKLKWKQVPCIVEENLSQTLMDARVIKDNKTYGSFDYDILLSGLYDESMLIDCGFLQVELSGVEDISLEDEEVKEQKEKKVKVCPNCGHEL